MFPHAAEVFISGLVAAMLSLGGLVVHRAIARRRQLFWKVPGGRHWHLRSLPSGGGWPILTAFVLALLVHPTFPLTSPMVGVFLGLGILLIAGLLDDMRSRSWRWMLFLQVFAACILIAFGTRLFYVNGFAGGAVRLDLWLWEMPQWVCFTDACLIPVLGTLLVIGWIVAFANTFNWLDGSDGAAVSVASVTFIGLIVLSLSQTVDQPPIAIASAAGLGAVLPFLFFNAPKARLMLGSSGSYGIAFVLGSLAIIAGAKIATVAMMVLLPLADACAVVGVRLLARQRPWLPDMRHLHHDLARRGWSAWKILSLHAACSIIFGALALFVPRPEKLVVLGAVFLFCVIALFILKVQKKENALQE